VEYEDTRTIATPEGVELRLRLAGVGSRFAAGMIDAAIKGAIVLVIALVFGIGVGGVASLVVTGAGLLFVMDFYDVLFEVRSAGRTPGKRALGLRVVMADGGPVGLRASTVRNLLRLVEGLPLSYVPAIVSILVTRSNQRLGDLAAGTVVVHEARAGKPAPDWSRPVIPAYTEAWDVSAVTPQELAAVRDFLRRRHDFTPAARTALAERLAHALQGRVAGVRTDMPAERFLEDLAAAKAARR
jgi:uncharacterized RDD family membrane protein YckC